MTELKKEAINLMLEDLHTIHGNIRERAKILNCEQELDDLKNCLIEYLDQIRSNV